MLLWALVCPGRCIYRESTPTAPGWEGRDTQCGLEFEDLLSAIPILFFNFLLSFHHKWSRHWRFKLQTLYHLIFWKTTFCSLGVDRTNEIFLGFLSHREPHSLGHYDTKAGSSVKLVIPSMSVVQKQPQMIYLWAYSTQLWHSIPILRELHLSG